MSQLRDYWGVALVMIAACAAVYGYMWRVDSVAAEREAATAEALAAIRSDIRDLTTVVNINVSRLNEFANLGPRWTQQDHLRYADQQQAIVQGLAERVTILEQQFNRR